jgi:hypothetical protein
MKKPRRLLSYILVAIFAILGYSTFHHEARAIQRWKAGKVVDYAWGSIIYRFQNHPNLARRRRQLPWTKSSLFRRILNTRTKGDKGIEPGVIRTLIVTAELVGLTKNGGIGTAFAELASTLSNQDNIQVSILVPRLAKDFTVMQRQNITNQ